MAIGLGIGIGISIGGVGLSGDPVPAIRLSARTIAEDASVNDVIGVLSVANGSGSYTFSITADPDSKFAIANDDELQLGDTLDYETATSHSVTIEADNGVDAPISRTFAITVTNVSVIPSTISDLTAEVLDHESVELSYTPASDADSYEYRFREVGDTEWSEAAELVADTVSGLSPETGYQFQVRGVSTDPEAEDAAWSNTATATTEAEPDVSGPTVSSFTPSDNAATVSVSTTSLIVTFNEAIQFGSAASIRLYKTSGDVLVQEWTLDDVLILAIDGDQLEMTLDEALEYGTDYYVQIDSGSVEDLASNAYAGISNETTWNFTTAAIAPSAFVSGDWSIAPGDEEAEVTISSLPAANGSAITDIEYRLDGGSWVSSGGTTGFTITGLTNDQEYDVELRAINSVGAGAASDTKQVTPEAEASGSSFDTIVATAVGAYSMRKLRSAYSGSAIEVYNETTSADIGFSGANLDTAALASHAPTNGQVTKWYDQSGNGATLTQSGGGVPIRSSGSTITKNSLPAPHYSGNRMLSAGAMSVAEIVVVLAIDASSTFPNYSAVVASDTDQVGLVGHDGTSAWHTGSGATMTTFTRDGSVTSTPLFNGALQVIGAYGTATNLTKLKLGEWTYGALAGNICELLCFSSQLSTEDRATVYANLKAYWGTA